MISKQQQKYVQSLHNKKYRSEFSQFLVEGEKGILEILNSDFKIEIIYCTEFLREKIEKINPKTKILVCNTDTISSISTFKTNTTGVAIVNQKETALHSNSPSDSVILVLDDIKDPGNLGTIIRLADWYGLSNIYCSEETVEFYNPKVIAATMGSFCRINCHNIDVKEFLKNLNLPKYGAFLDGQNIHKTKVEGQICLVIGSESHGISPKIEKLIDNKITIPRIGKAESLNAAIATGILLDNIFRAS